jgi:hypothetical protein
MLSHFHFEVNHSSEHLIQFNSANKEIEQVGVVVDGISELLLFVELFEVLFEVQLDGVSMVIGVGVEKSVGEGATCRESLPHGSSLQEIDTFASQQNEVPLRSLII